MEIGHTQMAKGKGGIDEKVALQTQAVNADLEIGTFHTGVVRMETAERFGNGHVQEASSLDPMDKLGFAKTVLISCIFKGDSAIVPVSQGGLQQNWAPQQMAPAAGDLDWRLVQRKNGYR